MVTLELISSKEYDGFSTKEYRSGNYVIKANDVDGIRTIDFTAVKGVCPAQISVNEFDKPMLEFTNGAVFTDDIEEFVKQAKEASEIADYIKEHYNELF
nr:hypothetical protein [uncultured Butyrivibrio sp.]